MALQDTTPLKLRLPAHEASVEQARLAVLAWLGDVGLTPRVRTSVEVVIEEVVMNLARHAYANTAGQTFLLLASRQGEELLLQFIDTGRAFDPAAAEPPALPASIADAQPGGLGLTLLKRRTRSMRHERRDGVNWLNLTVALGSDPSPAPACAAGMGR